MTVTHEGSQHVYTSSTLLRRLLRLMHSCLEQQYMYIVYPTAPSDSSYNQLSPPTLNMSLRLVAMASSMVTSFLGSVEVEVKEDWDELSEKASTRPLHRDPSHDLQQSRTHTIIWPVHSQDMPTANKWCGESVVLKSSILQQ